MKSLSKDYLIGIGCLFGLVFHPGISSSMVIGADFSETQLRSDTSEFVSVSGIVVDEKGAAIPNVSVCIAGTYRNGRLSQSDGSFEIKVPGKQKFYLDFLHISYVGKSVLVNSESEIQGLNVVLKESICHLDLINELCSCLPDEYPHDLPVHVFKSTEDSMEINIDISRAETAGGIENFIQKFKIQKKAVLSRLKSSDIKLNGHYQGTFIVDSDGVVKRLTLESVSDSKVAEVIEEIFQKTGGKWKPAKQIWLPVTSKFSFSVEFP